MLLVAYDITNDRRRTKVAKALVRVGQRVQYSVFLVEHRSPKEIVALLRPLIRKNEDNVRIHPLCSACFGKALLIGRDGLVQLPEGFRVV